MFNFKVNSLSSKILDITKDAINELAIKAANSLKTKDGKLMNLVTIKGEGMGYFWSPYDKRFLFIPRSSEFYILPWKKDEKGRNYLFLPHYLTGGTVICVESDEIEQIGLN